MNDLKVHSWPIDEPIPYARNSRKIPERAIDKVAASIKEFGFRVPIVVDKGGVVFAPDLFATPFERLSERGDRDFHRDFAINPDRVHLTRYSALGPKRHS